MQLRYNTRRISWLPLSLLFAGIISLVPSSRVEAIITDQDAEMQTAYRNRVCCDCSFTAPGSTSPSHLYLMRQDDCSNICSIDADHTAHPRIPAGTLTCSVVQTGCTSRADLDTAHTCGAAPAPTPPPTAAPRQFRSINPNPSVPIPGVEFTPAVQNGSVVSIPFLAQYIGGIFRFLIGLGAVVASAMVVYGGFRYLMAASLPDVKDGKETISDAILGLVVLLGSYVILQTINPELLNLRPLSLNVARNEQIRTADNSGNPNPSVNPDDYPTGTVGDIGCGAGRTETHFGQQFYVLPLRNNGYYQGQTPWGPIAYGPNLNESPAQSRNPCKSGSEQGDGCIGTLAQGACGPASVATVAAYYGVMVADPKANELVDNARMWSGSGSNAQLQPLSQVSPRIATLLRARSQSHLFDPLDAAALASRPGGGRVVNGGTTSLNFVRFIPGGFTSRTISASPTRSAEIARLIQSGEPVVFHCRLCQMNQLRNAGGTPTIGSREGHFMVLHGVSQNGEHFLIHDVGWSNENDPHIGLTISAQELNTAPSDRVATWEVRPENRSIQNCGNPTTGGASAPTSQGGATSGSGSNAVRTQNFSYRPSGGDRGWQDNQSAVFFPERLMTELNRYPSGNPQRPRLRLFIFIHGINDGMHSFSQAHYPAYMQSALGTIAARKNVIIATPHYMGTPYLQNFNLASFYSQTMTQLGSTIPGFRPTDIQDVVVGAHSAGTCTTPRGLGPARPAPQTPPILQAISSPLPNEIGLIAYDGCAGTTLTPTNFHAVGGRMPIYINADLRGMGDDDNRNATIKRVWELPTTSSCPSGLQSAAGVTVSCFVKSTPSGEIGLFETQSGHNESILPMTKMMLRAFYGS